MNTNSKPKLCIVLPKYSTNTDTHYYHLLELVEKLTETHQVFLFAESGSGPIATKNLAGFYLQSPKILPFRFFERLWVFTKLRLRGFKIFYCHYSELSTILCGLITRVLGGTTYKWHCVQEHLYSKPWKLTTIKEKLTREVTLALAFSLTHKLVTCTPSMKRYYQKHFGFSGHKLVVIPNFVCPDRFHPTPNPKTSIRKNLNLPANKKILLFVHHLSPRKGADRLIDLAQEIKSKKYNYTIVVIGAGPLLNQLKKKSKQSRLSQQLLFLGSQPNHKIPLYYQAADVFILPSRTEEFGRVIIEAMATGLPVIATDTLGSRSILTGISKKFIVPQTQIRSMIQLSHRLLSNSKHYKQISQYNLDTSTKYHLEHIAHMFSHLFSSGN